MEKISVKNSEFRNKIIQSLKEGKQLVIWHQIPWSGGSQEWFLIQQEEELNRVLAKGRIASAFTVYEWIEIPLPSMVDQIWFTQTKVALSQEKDNAMILLSVQSPSNKLVWIGEDEDLENWFEGHKGMEVDAGRIPNLWYGEIIRGYYPDEQGIPQSGPN